MHTAKHILHTYIHILPKITLSASHCHTQTSLLPIHTNYRGQYSFSIRTPCIYNNTVLVLKHILTRASTHTQTTIYISIMHCYKNKHPNRFSDP